MTVIFSAIDAQAWAIILTAVIMATGKIILDWKLAREAAAAVERVRIQAEIAESKVKDVKTKLDTATQITDEKIDGLTKTVEDSQKTGNAIHILVNNSMSVQLKLTMLALQRVAELSKGSQSHGDDVRAAQTAERLYLEHEGKQSKLDDLMSPKKDEVTNG